MLQLYYYSLDIFKYNNNRLMEKTRARGRGGR